MRKLVWMTLIVILWTPLGLFAEDTEIYGTITSAGVEPNVLIIFDNSGSMDTNDVPGDPYDPAIVYTGSRTAAKVYYSTRWGWSTFANDVNSLSCTAVKDLLLTQGWAKEKIRWDTSCGGRSKRHLRTGNYLNYVESGFGVTRRRIDVAKEVVSGLINTTANVRFGLFTFNWDQGGHLVAGCGTSPAALVTEVNNMVADGWTPLAETLAEAGLYFAGEASWYNSGVTYTTPIQERCQKNYIIIMTDGQSTQDQDWRLTSGAYINGDTIGDYDNDHPDNENDYASYGSDYLDDVAKYLFENDCNTAIGDGTAFDKQNITTFTIGFKHSDQLLEDTAANGGGLYYTASNVSELNEAFQQIMSLIAEENAVFVAPVVPISRMNRTYADDKIYLGFFKPQQSGRWIGNIKRYDLDNNGDLTDINGMRATTDDGLIKDNAWSYWTSMEADGPDVENGGVAEVLAERIELGSVDRNLYTYTGTQALLTDSTNALSPTNTAITNSMVGVSTDTERQNLINGIHAAEMGDIIHSEPAVEIYKGADGVYGTGDDKTLIFVGANDGLLHCFDDVDGNELWAFVPPSQLSRLPLLDSADHDYFVDGSPSIFDTGSQKILVIGERRGGESYTALDITDYTAPRYLYSVTENILDPNPTNNPDTDVYEHLGQSWSRPVRATVVTAASVSVSGFPACSVDVTTATQDVYLFAGGYDTNQDSDTPNANDSVGRAIFAIDAVSGSLVSGLNISPTSHTAIGMTHSIVDVAAFDPDGDGITNRIYFTDMGGNIYAFRDGTENTYSVCGQSVTQTISDGTWQGIKLFSASAVDGVQRKLMYAPDVTLESGYEFVFLGTGDRTDPGETGVVNRFYAVKNDWTTTSALDETDLVDVTANLIQLGTQAEQNQVSADLTAGKGWFIRFDENAGEKVVATPRVFGGVVYFTTYTPSSGSGGSPGDPCVASTVRGVARLYALDYKTGASVVDWSSETEIDGDGNVVEKGRKDRALAIGTAIPSASVIAVLKCGARGYAGLEGGIFAFPAALTQDMHRYFWNQVSN